jgi:hypothetical protein
VNPLAADEAVSVIVIVIVIVIVVVVVVVVDVTRCFQGGDGCTAPSEFGDLCTGDRPDRLGLLSLLSLFILFCLPLSHLHLPSTP